MSVFLLNGYSEGGIGVDRIVTHAAHSAVDGSYVSKFVEKLTHRFLHKLAHS